ncbi:MAG: carboxypeptidase-like regulatory domain-containing protein [Bacteroidota bacterium]
MKKIICLLSVLLTFAFTSNVAKADGGETSKKICVQGKVTDKNTGEALAGVLIYIKETNQSTYTDLEGNFKFAELYPGTLSIAASFISYEETSTSYSVADNQKTINIQLEN